MEKELKEDIVLEFANYIKSKLYDLGNVVMPEDIYIMANEFLGGDNEENGKLED